MDGFIVTTGDGTAIANTDDDTAFIHVFNTLKEVNEARTMVMEPVVYALVAIPVEYVPYIVDNRTHGMTKAAILHDMALRFIGTLPWPDGSLPDPSETAESLADLDEPTDTWKE